MAVLDWLVLPTIVFAQFAGTSLWFAPNAVVSEVGFGREQVSALTSCVQAGFIFGTLTLTYFAVADRFSPPALFAVFTLIGAVFNAACLVAKSNFAAWVVLRTVVGFTLAGVYPVGMKIAAQEYPEGLGARLGVLVGALTLGTAFPWLVRGVGDSSGLPYEGTIVAVSILASLGAALMALMMIPRQGGPGAACLGKVLACCSNGGAHKESERRGDSTQKMSSDDQKTGSARCPDREAPPAIPQSDEDDEKDNEAATIEAEVKEQPSMGTRALREILADSRFRAAAIGYFGHMWELYAFWAFVPILIERHAERHGGAAIIRDDNVALTTFATIAIGSVSCAIAGLWSLRAGGRGGILPGSAVAAETALLVSFACCLLAPAYQSMNPAGFLVYLLVWGSAVVADSAQFSSLCAAYACPNLVGTALTLTTCVGFSVTIVSIQMVGALLERGWDPGHALALLAVGPFVGLGWSYKEWPLHVVVCPAAKDDSHDDMPQ